MSQNLLMSARRQTEADERRARYKSIQQAQKKLQQQVEDTRFSDPSESRRSQRRQRLLGIGRPLYPKVDVKACAGLVVCGAKGDGAKELTGITADLAVAEHVMEWRGIPMHRRVDVNTLACCSRKVLSHSFLSSTHSNSPNPNP